ncbi:CotH kinase family protein [Psychroserpens sp. S379A]|uniref:CotH kinase family protein n=1 Tax=Psychroserpens sp. S379A TaxID=3415137 RepID=UPI003C7EC35C
MKLPLLLIILFFTKLLTAQELTINVLDHNFGIDENKSLIVSHIDDINNYSNTSEYSEITITLGQNSYNFDSVPNSLDYLNSYLINDIATSNQYTIYFTQLPIILIDSDNAIVDEPKVLANFVYSDEEQTLVSNIGIELRGGSSQSYPKKTYDIEFWDDELGDETKNEQFGELRNDDDWILDALYNEPLRLRSYIANKLWLEIHTPYYISDEPNAKSGADVMYVEMFLNGQYNGVYNLSEQVDKKQLKLKSFNDNMRGELYKGVSWGASTFTDIPSYDNESRLWSGYEFKYPKEDEITDWTNLYQFTDFVINSSVIDFTNTIWTRFNEDNYINYFLFLNLIRATDNTGKNIYLAKYNTDEPYIYIPWDLDGCFGTIWNGTNDNTTNDILSNGFINRVIDINPNNISPNIASTWFDYRSTIFSSESLSNNITDQYNFLQTNKIYERESLVYPNYSFDNQDLSYTLNWLEDRLEYLDIYFGDFLSVDSLTHSDKMSMYPNPVKDKIYIHSTSKLNDKNYKIYNNLGQLVTEGIIQNDFISFEKFKRGLYFIKLDGNTYKLIKE